MATTSSNNDDDHSAAQSSDDDEDDDSAAGELQKFFENDVNVKPADKIPFVINLCFGYLDDFSTEVEPYNHQLFKNSKKKHKIVTRLLTVEIKRRDSSAKLSNKKQHELLEMIKSNPLPAKDFDYLKRQENIYKAQCQQAIDEHTQSNATTAAAAATSDRGPNITLDDRLRMIEAFFSDKAKERLAATQNCLTRQELDARNSVLAVEDYFEIVAKVFNDPDWVPTLKTYPELHPELASSRELPLKDYRANRSKVKDKYGEMKNQLHGMVINYEKSGNGGMQRSDTSNDWGSFNFDDLVDGDDRSSFLPDNNQELFYLLYYWQRLDEEGQVQFTLAKLPNWMKANSGQFALTSSGPSNRSSTVASEKAFTQLSASIGTVGDSIATYAVASMGRNVDKFEKDLFALEMKMVDIDSTDPRYILFSKRKHALEQNIKQAKSDEEEARKRLKKTNVFY